MSERPGVPMVFALVVSMCMFGAHVSGSAGQGSQPYSDPTGLITSFQTDDPWWASDDESYATDDPWSTTEDGSYGTDDPWWASDDESYETDDPWSTDDDEPYESDEPWWATDDASDEPDDPWSTTDDTCYGIQCESDRVWWQDEAGCYGSFCEDNPWNGSTTGCSYGWCEDDSFLVNCSYVTVSGYGVEGACDTHLGGTRYDNCYPVSGSGALSGMNQQTFRCTDAPGYSSTGYSLTDIAPASDDDVVLVLCSGGDRTGAVEPDTCESAPSGIDYYTCQQDSRMSAPIGTDQEWYVCER